MNPFSKF